jgi:hypothetical protein
VHCRFLIAVVVFVTFAVLAAPAAAQGDPTPTATSVAPTPTPSPTPAATAVAFDDASLLVGQPVTASGSAADGDYCLCLVPAGVFSIGATFDGAAVSCVGLTISGGSFSGVTVNPAVPAGQFDLLLLAGACGAGGVIVAGDALDDRVGLEAQEASAIPSVTAVSGLLALALIAVAGATLLWRRA